MDNPTSPGDEQPRLDSNARRLFWASFIALVATAFGFILAVATGYCLTLPVSAKPLAMMSEIDAPTFEPRDLLKLSAILLPFHVVLLLVFSLWIWPSLGLPLGSPVTGGL